jgi:hypothetical protein
MAQLALKAVGLELFSCLQIEKNSSMWSANNMGEYEALIFGLMTALSLHI